MANSSSVRSRNRSGGNWSAGAGVGPPQAPYMRGAHMGAVTGPMGSPLSTPPVQPHLMQQNYADMATSTSVGFAKDDLSFAEELPKQMEIVCPVCYEVMLTEPHLVTCCGHHFCGPCIERVKSTPGSSCPMCNEKEFQAVFDKGRLRIINELQVYCTNKEKGCQWKRELKNLSTHLNRGKREGECQFEEAKCRFEKCPVIMKQRQHLDEHEKIGCRQRPYQCHYCKYKDTYQLVTKVHYHKCPQYPVYCSNKRKGCQWKGERQNLSSHLSKEKREGECQFEDMKCQYKKCPVSKERRHLSDHEKNECPQRLVLCFHCKQRGTYQFITEEHLPVCPQYPVPCLNKCLSDGKTLPRAALATHLSTECPLQSVECMFIWAGCTDKPLRKDSQQHTTDPKHMSLLAVACGQLKRENETLAVACGQLKETCGQLKGENEKLVQACGQMKKEKEELASQFKIHGQINHYLLAGDSYPILPVDVTVNGKVVHFYTDVCGCLMSVTVDYNERFETATIYIALHEGKFDKFQPEVPRLIATHGNKTILLITDTEATYQRLPLDILSANCNHSGVIIIKCTALTWYLPSHSAVTIINAKSMVQ